MLPLIILGGKQKKTRGRRKEEKSRRGKTKENGRRKEKVNEIS